MSKTHRNIPIQKWMRTPKYKHKLLAGQSIKTVVTDWDDNPIAALKEKHKFLCGSQQ